MLRERRPASAFPILPILCLILFGFGFCAQKRSLGSTLKKKEREAKWRADRNIPKSISKRSVIEMRKELARKIACARAIGGAESHSHSRPVALPPDEADFLLSGRLRTEPDVFVQGQKRINLGGNKYICDGSSFLLSSIDVPAESQIVEASEQVPLLSMFLRLDMPTVREVMSREELPESETAATISRTCRRRDDGWDC